MKKISVNNDDSYFINKNKFKDTIKQIKAVSRSLIKNTKQGCKIAILYGTILFSVNNIYNFGEHIISSKAYNNTSSQKEEEVSSNNDKIIEEMSSNGICVVNNVPFSIEPYFYLVNNKLYDRDFNIIYLDGEIRPVSFIGCKIDNKTFDSIRLSSSLINELYLDYSSIENDFINYLPNTIEALSLNGCVFITDLSELPNKCPNIKSLSLNRLPDLSDFSFIYNLPNLEEIYISDSAYMTEDVLNYLTSHNITTNITKQDIINSKRVDDIINEIIEPQMSDRQKIQAICLYILDNVEYDITQTKESNENPLTCVLEDGKGVCASYAYFTQVLLKKAGINSFKIENDNHAWNAVKLDNKYYYIDTTNMDGGAIYNFLLRILNINAYYMVDTNNDVPLTMTNPEDNRTVIPLSLIEDIQKGRDEKEIFEKYSATLGTMSIILASILNGLITGCGLGAVLYIEDEFKDYLKKVNKDYKVALEESTIKR